MVSAITDEDVHSIYEVRLLVEPYALRVYGAQIPREGLERFVGLMQHPETIPDFYAADDAFHELLISPLPNKYLRSAHDSITGQNTRFRIMTGKVGMISQKDTCSEHLAILTPALAGDWDAAAAALTRHLELAGTRPRGCWTASTWANKLTQGEPIFMRPIQFGASRLPHRAVFGPMAGLYRCCLPPP